MFKPVVQNVSLVIFTELLWPLLIQNNSYTENCHLLQIYNITILIWEKERGIPEFSYRDTGHLFSPARQLKCLKWLPFVHTVIGTQVTHTKPHLHYLDSKAVALMCFLPFEGLSWSFVALCTFMKRKKRERLKGLQLSGGPPEWFA